jgi:hypothetical protein
VGGIPDAINVLKSLIDNYNSKLNSNVTFGVNGQYVIAGKTYKSKMPKVEISYQNNIEVKLNNDSVDFKKTYFERFGKQSTDSSQIDALKTELNSLVKSSAVIDNLTNKITYQFFKFEGDGSFTKIIEKQQNLLNSQINEIQSELTKILSERLTKKDGGLGFKPTIKNVIAVLMASSEGFLRLMCDVHEKAWNQKENKYRLQSILGNDKTVESPDAKNSVQTDTGNLIPIYPWPQFFVETNNEKGEPYVIGYPGDPKVISKTKAYLYDIWPEVQFVEEFLKGKTLIPTGITEYNPITNTAQVINRVSFNALDFPLSNVLFANKSESKFMYEMWERVFISGAYQRFAKPNALNDYANTIAETEFLNISESLLPDSYYLLQKLKQYGFNSSNFVPFLNHISSGGLGESWQKYIRDDFATNYIQQEVDNSFAILSNEIITPNNNVVTLEPKEINNFKAYLKSTKSNTADLVDTFPFSLDNWFKTNLADGSGSSQTLIYNTTNVLDLNNEKKVISNFQPNTTQKEIRPITNFNFYNVTMPNPSEAELKTFYTDRKPKDQLPTEGSVFYRNYDGALSNYQSTSMLNTPYFVNSIQEGVSAWLTGSTHPYVAASFLFLNSLPLATLREKYKTYNGTATNDLDYIFTSLKKFGAIHKIPYSWVLKYGSIWHRYKIWVDSGYDILQPSWTDFNTTKNFDPVTSNPNKSYSLIVNTSLGNVPVDITLQSATTLNSNTSVLDMNIGFYPKVINDFNLFCRGYDLFTGYTNLDIQRQLSNTSSGFTLTLNKLFTKSKGYDPNNTNEELSLKPWTCTLVDSKTSKQYIVPSFGTFTNQFEKECFKDNGKLKKQVKSNPAIFNGSVRTFWSLPNYGYFDDVLVDIPSPEQYMKTIYTNQSQQESFSFGDNAFYTSIEEMFSVFEKDILDKMENEFLKFSKSMYDYEVVQKDEFVVTRVQINTLPTDTNGVNRNFQLLMRELLTTTATTSNSQTYVDDLKNNQFSNAINTIQRFLEYDVAIKYANPSGYNRKLFDSYANNKFVEDKITFNGYVSGTLPGAGGTTLANSIASNPQTWKDLKTYVGFSTENGIEYNNTGSTITDFFVDMNIEFTSDSVKTLAPLIKIYATQKKKDNTFNRAKMFNEITGYLNTNLDFTNMVFNLLCQKLQKELPNVQQVVDEKQTTTAVQGEQTKVDLWEKFKGLNDSWIAGYDYTQTTFMEDVLLLDRANRNIGDEVYIDPVRVRQLLSDVKNAGGTVYSYLESLLSIHHFICMMHPAYINYYNVQEVSKNNIPKTEGTLDFANTLFGTYLNVDTRSASPKLVCTYAAEPSKYPDMKNNENFRFKSDSFEFKCGGGMPLFDKLEGKTDWGLSNKVVGFNVDIGIRNQNIFNHFDVSQELGKQTSESLMQTDSMINQANGKQIATQNVSLWNFYNNRSYQSRVTCLGNVMIQPTMYFNLRYVPMFYGPYYIMDVKHDITPGKFQTSFTGIRQQVFALPPLENYMQTLTKELLTNITQKIKQAANTSSTSGTLNNNPNNSPANTTSTYQVDNPANCYPNMQNKFKTRTNSFTAATQNQTNINSQDLANGIKTNIVDGLNIVTTRILSFVSIYLESFNGNYFSCWNNNYPNALLSYAWPDGQAKFFDKSYLCLIQSNGVSGPTATFSTIENMYKFLEAKWGPVSNFSPTPENIAEKIIGKFNVNVTPTADQINAVLPEVKNAIDLAITLQLDR